MATLIALTLGSALATAIIRSGNDDDQRAAPTPTATSTPTFVSPSPTASIAGTPTPTDTAEPLPGDDPTDDPTPEPTATGATGDRGGDDEETPDLPRTGVPTAADGALLVALAGLGATTLRRRARAR